LVGGAVGGILNVSDYVTRSWLSLAAIASVLTVLGGLAVVVNIEFSALSVSALLDPARPFVYRGTSILAAAAIMFGVAATLGIAGRDLPD
jgi:hypothetical protein